MPNPNNNDFIREDNPLKNRNNAANDGNELLRDRDEEIENFEEDYWNDKEEEQDEELGEEVDPLDEVVLELDGSELSAEEIALEDKKDDKKDKKKKKYEDWDYETYADKDTHKLDYDVYADSDVFAAKAQEIASQNNGVQQPAPQQTTESENLTGFTINEFGVVQSVNYEENVAKAHDNDQSTTAEFHKIQDLENRNEVKEQVHTNDNVVPETVPHTAPVEEKPNIPSHTGDAHIEQPANVDIPVNQHNPDVVPQNETVKVDEPYIVPDLNEQPSAPKNTHSQDNTIQHTPNVDATPIENISIPVDVNKGQEEKIAHVEDRPVNIETPTGSSQTIEQPNVTETVKTPVIENEPVKQEVQTGEHKTEVYDEPTFIPRVEEKVDNTVPHNERVEEATPFEFNVGSYKSHVQEGGEQPTHIKTDDNQPQNIEHFDVPGSNEPVVNIPVVEETIPHTETPIHTEEILTEHMPTQHNEINNDVQVPKAEISSNDFVEEIHTPRENVITQPDVSVKTEEKVDVHAEQPRVENIVDNIPTNDTSRVDNNIINDNPHIDNNVHKSVNDEIDNRSAHQPTTEPSVISHSDSSNKEVYTEQPTIVVPPVDHKQETNEVPHTTKVEEPSAPKTEAFTVGSYQSHVQEGAEKPTHHIPSQNADSMANDSRQTIDNEINDIPKNIDNVVNDIPKNVDNTSIPGSVVNDNKHIDEPIVTREDTVKPVNEHIPHEQVPNSPDVEKTASTHTTQTNDVVDNKVPVDEIKTEMPRQETYQEEIHHNIADNGNKAADFTTEKHSNIADDKTIPHVEKSDNKVSEPTVISHDANYTEQPTAVPNVEKKSSDDMSHAAKVEEPSVPKTEAFTVGSYQSHVQEGAEKPSHHIPEQNTNVSGNEQVKEGVVTNNIPHKEDIPSVEQNIGTQPVPDTTSKERFDSVANEQPMSKIDVKAENVVSDVKTEPSISHTGHEQMVNEQPVSPKSEAHSQNDVKFEQTTGGTQIGDNVVSKTDVNVPHVEIPKSDNVSNDIRQETKVDNTQKANDVHTEQPIVIPNVEHKPSINEVPHTAKVEEPSTPKTETFNIGSYQSHVQEGATQPTHIPTQKSAENIDTVINEQPKNDHVPSHKEEVVNTPETPVKTPHVESKNIGDTNTTVNTNNEQKVFTSHQNDVKEAPIDKNIETPKATENIVSEQPKVEIPKNAHDNVVQSTSPNTHKIENIPNVNEIKNEVHTPGNVEQNIPSDIKTNNIPKETIQEQRIPAKESHTEQNVPNEVKFNVETVEHKPQSNSSEQVRHTEIHKEDIKVENIPHKEDVQPKIEVHSVEQNAGVKPTPDTTSKERTENVIHSEPSVPKTEVKIENVPHNVKSEPSISTGSVQTNEQHQAMPKNDVYIPNEVKDVPVQNTHKQPETTVEHKTHNIEVKQEIPKANEVHTDTTQQTPIQNVKNDDKVNTANVINEHKQETPQHSETVHTSVVEKQQDVKVSNVDKVENIEQPMPKANENVKTNEHVHQPKQETPVNTTTVEEKPVVNKTDVSEKVVNDIPKNVETPKTTETVNMEQLNIPHKQDEAKQPSIENIKAAEVITNNETPKTNVHKEQGQTVSDNIPKTEQPKVERQSEPVIDKVPSKASTVDNVVDIAGGVAAGVAVSAAAEKFVEAGVVGNIPKVDITTIPEQTVMSGKQPEVNTRVDDIKAAEQVKINQETKNETHAPATEHKSDAQTTTHNVSEQVKPAENMTSKENVKSNDVSNGQNNIPHKEEVQPKTENIPNNVKTEPSISTGSEQTVVKNEAFPKGETNVPNDVKVEVSHKNENTVPNVEKQPTVQNDTVKTGDVAQPITPKQDISKGAETIPTKEQNVSATENVVINKTNVSENGVKVEAHKEPAQPIANTSGDTPKTEAVKPEEVKVPDNKQAPIDNAEVKAAEIKIAEQKHSDNSHTGNKTPVDEHKNDVPKQNGAEPATTPNNVDKQGSEKPSVNEVPKTEQHKETPNVANDEKVDTSTGSTHNIEKQPETKSANDTKVADQIKANEVASNKENINNSSDNVKVDNSSKEVKNDKVEQTPTQRNEIDDKVQTPKTNISTEQPKTNTSVKEENNVPKNDAKQPVVDAHTTEEIKAAEKIKAADVISSKEKTNVNTETKPETPTQSTVKNEAPAGTKTSGNKEDVATAVAGVAGVAAAQKAKEEFIMPDLSGVSDDVIKKSAPKVEKPTGEKVEIAAKEVKSSEPSDTKATKVKDGEQTANITKPEKVSLEERATDAVVTAKKFSANEEFSSGMSEKKPVDTKPNVVEDVKTSADKPKVDDKKLAEQAAKKTDEKITVSGDVVAPQLDKGDNSPKETVIQAIKTKKEQGADPKSANIPPQGEVIRTTGGIKPEALEVIKASAGNTSKVPTGPGGKPPVKCPKCGKPIDQCICGKGGGSGSGGGGTDGNGPGGKPPVKCPKCGKPIDQCICGKDGGGGSGGGGSKTEKPDSKNPRVDTKRTDKGKDGKGRIKKDETTAKKLEAVGTSAVQKITHSIKAKVMEASDHHEERTARMGSSLSRSVVNAVATMGAMSAVRALKYKDKIFNESAQLSKKLLSEGKITLADLTSNDKGKALKEKLTKAGYSDSDISRVLKHRKDVAGTFEMREKLIKNLRDDVNAKLKIVTEKNANIDQIKEALTKRVSQMKGFENVDISKLSNKDLAKILNARGEEGRMLAVNLINARQLASAKGADFRAVSLQYLAMSNNETVRSLAEVVGRGRSRIHTLSDGQLKDLIEQAKKGLKTGNFSHADLTALKMEFDKRMLRRAKNKAPRMRGIARSLRNKAMRIIDEASNSNEIRTLSQFTATIASTVRALNSVKRFAQNRISRVSKRTHEFLMKHSSKYRASYEKKTAKRIAKNEKKVKKQAQKVEKDLKMKRELANKVKNTKAGKAVDRGAKKAKDLAKNAKDRFMATKAGKAVGKAGKTAGKAGKAAGKVAGKASKVVAAPFKFFNAAKALMLKVALIVALVIVIVMMFSYLSLALMEFATPVMDTLDKIGEVAADFWSWITGDVDPYTETRRIYNKLLEKDDKAEEVIKDLIHGEPKFPVTFYGRPITHYTNKKVTYVDAYGNPTDYSTRHPAKTAIALAYVYAGDNLYEMTRSDREQLIYDIYTKLTTVVDYGQTYVYSCYCESNSCRGNYYDYECCGEGYEAAGRYFESLQADIHSDKVDSRFQGVNGSSFIIGINKYYAIDPTKGDITGYTAYCNGHPVYATDPETGESIQVTTYYHNGGRFWTGQKSIVVNVGCPGEGRVELEVDGVTYTYYSGECHDYTIYETHPVCTQTHTVQICTGHVDISLKVQRAVYTDILETNWVPHDDELFFKYDKWLKDFVWTEEKKALVIEYIEKTDWKEVYGIG